MWLRLNCSLLLIQLATTAARSATTAKNRDDGSRDAGDGELRLKGGNSKDEGNVEIFYAGRWGAVCDDEWDMADATVACRQLGYGHGAVTFTTDSYFGRFSETILLDNVRCTGHERRLDSCPHDGWRHHDCNSMEAAGVVCRPNPLVIISKYDGQSNSTGPSPITVSDIFGGETAEIRLTNGRTSSEGRVEFTVPWRGLICGTVWTLREAMVACRQLGLGYAQQATRGDQFVGADQGTPFLLRSVSCNGDESKLSMCKAMRVQNGTCPGDLSAGVVCSQELPDLLLDLDLVRDSVYLHDQYLHYLQCAVEENCLSTSVGSVIRESGWYYKIRRLLRFSTKVYNIGDADFLPSVAKGQWQWHQCHMHYHSMEVFSHYDIIDPVTGRRMAEGHKASFCLEDTDCPEGMRKRYRCANYGDQGISPGCWDTYLHDIDCQWIDITDLKPGTYAFKVAVNPEYKVAEKNFSNNGILCDLHYNLVQALVTNCAYIDP